MAHAEWARCGAVPRQKVGLATEAAGAAHVVDHSPSGQGDTTNDRSTHRPDRLPHQCGARLSALHQVPKPDLVVAASVAGDITRVVSWQCTGLWWEWLEPSPLAGEGQGWGGDRACPLHSRAQSGAAGSPAAPSALVDSARPRARAARRAADAVRPVCI